MERKIAREVLSALQSWIHELEDEGFKEEDFDFEEIVDETMKRIDHEKFK